LFSDLLRAKFWETGVHLEFGVESLNVIGVELTGGVIDDFVTFDDEGIKPVTDHGSKFWFKGKSVLDTRDEVILGGDFILESGDFEVPFLRDCFSLIGHGSHVGESAGKVLEIFFEVINSFSVIGKIGFEDTGTNGVAGGDTSWA